VLGSTISGIVMLVSRDLLKPVLLAVLIATPIAWWAMYRWLEGFAYHIGISAWIFIGAGLLALIVALVTVSIKALRAAMENPAKSLRTE
jgi:putative ABC transport system permease protein